MATEYVTVHRFWYAIVCLYAGNSAIRIAADSLAHRPGLYDVLSASFYALLAVAFGCLAIFHFCGFARYAWTLFAKRVRT